MYVHNVMHCYVLYIPIKHFIFSSYDNVCSQNKIFMLYSCCTMVHYPVQYWHSGWHSVHIIHLNLYRSDDQSITEIVLDGNLFKEDAFQRCLEFLYTGSCDVKKEDSEELTEATISAASMMNLPELAQMVQNAHKEEEYLNPSIGTWLNDRNGLVAKRLFLNNSLFSDITFKLDGVSVYAHRAILTSRCEFMSVMLNSDFLEGKSSEVHSCMYVHVHDMCVYMYVHVSL